MRQPWNHWEKKSRESWQDKSTDASVQFSCSVVSDSLRPHGLQHARPPCPSPTPRVYSNFCPWNRWCHWCCCWCKSQRLSQQLLLLSRFSRVQPCVTHRRQPTRLPRPWDSPGKNTGVGCHFLLQCRKVKSEREVAQSRLTLYNPMDCSPPGSSVHGIFQARVLEWGAIAFSTTAATRR